MTSVPVAVSDQTLPRVQRIARRRDFLHVYEVGRKEFGRHTVVFSHPNDLTHPRLGITVTRKVGKSHVRNRLRRWTREIYRTVRATTGLESLGLDLVVNVKPSAALVTFSDYSVDLTKIFRKCVVSAR